MEELVYLHDVWTQVREWEAVKKMRSEQFFLTIDDVLGARGRLVTQHAKAQDLYRRKQRGEGKWCITGTGSLSTHSCTRRYKVLYVRRYRAL